MCRIYGRGENAYVRICKKYGGPKRILLSKLDKEALEHFRRVGHLSVRRSLLNSNTRRKKNTERFVLYPCRVCGTPTMDEICSSCQEMCRKYGLWPSELKKKLRKEMEPLEPGKTQW